eukprot:295718_1
MYNMPWSLQPMPLSQRVDNTGRCFGEICQLNRRLYAVWCARLKPTDQIFVYFNIETRIVWIDCGCHLHTDCNKSNIPHIKYKTCHKNVSRLLNYALIGIVKYNSDDEFRRHFPTNECQFTDSELISKDLKCRNCKILLCLQLSKWLSKYMCDSNSIFWQSRDSFSKMLFIYIISQLLSYCLSNANTASFIVSNNYSESLVNFLMFALNNLQAFHQTAPDDKHNAILFRMIFDALTKFIKLLITHSSKFGNSWWILLKQKHVHPLSGIGHYLFLVIQNIINYFTNDVEFTNITFKNIYLTNTKIQDMLILPLILFLCSFRKIYIAKILVWIQCDELLYASTKNQRWLCEQLMLIYYIHKENLEQTEMYNYLKQREIYSSYVRITQKKMKWIYVQCQWIKCKRRKIDLIQNNTAYNWKKCRSCKIAKILQQKMSKTGLEQRCSQRTLQIG